MRPRHGCFISTQAAALLDLDPATQHDARFVEAFSGQRRLPGMDPITMLYAGHQFGRYVPQLGGGRAIILGETTNTRGEKWELQLEGSGQTPYSRAGDGRAVLRSSIREYLCSEAMHGLGIPTTRALCLIGSRGDASEIDRLLAILRNPFDTQPDREQYAQPAPASAAHIQVSCSS